MAGKRKRNRHGPSAADCPRKRLRAGSVAGLASGASADFNVIKHPVLSLYYPCVVTLRSYLLSKLPISSKARRRRLVAARNGPEQSRPGQKSPAPNVDGLTDGFNDSERSLAYLLDTTLVCGLERPCPAQDQSRVNDLATFSQQQSKATAGSSLGGGGNCSQSEVRSICLSM